jgi:hypothetical protein
VALYWTVECVSEATRHVSSRSGRRTQLPLQACAKVTLRCVCTLRPLEFVSRRPVNRSQFDPRKPCASTASSKQGTTPLRYRDARILIASRKCRCDIKIYLMLPLLITDIVCASTFSACSSSSEQPVPVQESVSLDLQMKEVH